MGYLQVLGQNKPMSTKPDELINLADVGTRLHLMRRALGMSQTEIARSLDWPVSGWNQWEMGKRLINVAVAAKIADRYAIPMEWIYMGRTTYLPYEFGKKMDALKHNPFPETVIRRRRA